MEAVRALVVEVEGIFRCSYNLVFLDGGGETIDFDMFESAETALHQAATLGIAPSDWRDAPPDALWELHWGEG